MPNRSFASEIKAFKPFRSGKQALFIRFLKELALRTARGDGILPTGLEFDK
jgi:hypothetical protein